MVSIIEAIKKIYKGRYFHHTCGDSLNGHASESDHPFIEKSMAESDNSGGSEDATYFMEEVQRNGGSATYCIIGTDLAAGHHNEKFDINEESLLPAVEILYDSIIKLNKSHI
ncbi:hypothetical protein [Siminovitchia sp. 179-K 8D1 HS]|uniref:hypothetical protein n=1 Tax=Siminovitchia sp. 179-K 8D1 HS TaxID=3142385 RepID=UPI00399FAC76